MGNPGLYDDAPAAPAARPRGIYAPRPQFPEGEGETPLFGAGTRDMSLNLLSESSPMDRPPPQSMRVEEPSGGLTTLAGGEGYGIGQQQQPVNPLAAQLASMTPAQLQEAMTSRTSSGSVSRLGGKPMPGVQQAYDRLGQQQQAAALAAGEAQSRGSLERAKAMEVAQAAQEHRQVAFDADIARERARAEKYDAQAAQMRAEIADLKVDPENYWSSRTTGEKFGIALGVALSQFGMILSKTSGPNPVLQMFERAIDRDIDAQKSNIQKKRGDLADVKGALADVYGKMGDMRSAENQTKILMMESLKSKLDVIGATTQSEVYRAAAQQQSATVGERIMQIKNQAWQAERPHITSGGSVSRPSALQAMMTAAQLSKATVGKELPKDEMDKVIAVRESNAREQEYAKALMDYRAKHQVTKGLAGKVGLAAYKVTGGIVGGDEATLNAQLMDLAALQVKARGGRQTPGRIEMVKPLYPGFMSDTGTTASKLAALAQERVGSLKSILQTWPDSKDAPRVYQALVETTNQLNRYKAAAGMSQR